MIQVVGCDPGGDGALFSVSASDGIVTPGGYLMMPMRSTGARVERVDVAAVADWLSALGPVSLLVLENVGYMPSGRAGGAFASSILTARVNQLIGMLDTMRSVPYELVQPRVWQSDLGIKIQPSNKSKSPPKTEDQDEKAKRANSAERRRKIKAAVMDFVRRRVPTANLVPPRCRVPHDGLSDALAMAVWGVNKMGSGSAK